MAAINRISTITHHTFRCTARRLQKQPKTPTEIYHPQLCIQINPQTSAGFQHTKSCYTPRESFNLNPLLSSPARPTGNSPSAWIATNPNAKT
jgi:hypothetical protein